MRRGLVVLLLLGSVPLALAGGAVGDSAAASGAAFVDVAQVQGQADFSDEDGGTIAPTATTVPRWSGYFTIGGVRYPYTMVGTSPVAARTGDVQPEPVRA